MWKFLYKFLFLISLSSCSQQTLDISVADDLNQFLPNKKEKTFFVKKTFLQSIRCQEIENWAKKNLPPSSEIYREYYFVEYDDELTLKGNPWLKKDAGAIVTSYSICSMYSDEKHCYICHEK